MSLDVNKAICPWLVKAAAFLNDEVGIPARLVEATEAGTFLPNIRICHGELEYTAVCDVSDLLHEAGHLATVPAQFRSYMDGDVSAGQKRMIKEVASTVFDPDAPLYRAMLQCSDPEATAWGWAVGEHLGIPRELRILDHHFENEGADQRLSLQMNSHFGINGLSHAGFCVTRPSLVAYMKKPAYPELLYWAHPVIEKDEPSRFAVMESRARRSHDDSSPSP